MSDVYDSNYSEFKELPADAKSQMVDNNTYETTLRLAFRADCVPAFIPGLFE